MTPNPTHGALRFPLAEAPAQGEIAQIGEGILWLRAPLPFRLNHLNIFLIEDGDGWAILDTGIASKITRAMWEEVVAGPLKGRKFTRLIVTHFHPDHIGLAGWLAERFDVPLDTTQTSYLQCANMSLSAGALDNPIYQKFYLKNGLDTATTSLVTTQGHGYLRMVVPLPPTFERIVAGDALNIGGRTFEVLTGEGHAPEQAMLYCREDKLFFAADQILEKITPNVSVWAVDPHGDPLGLYLRSLRQLVSVLPEDVLVLPGHHRPFIGAHVRAAELIDHHRKRCESILDACREPKPAAELLPAIFPRPLDPHEMSFAFSEVLAHVNYMLREGELVWAEPQNGVECVIAKR